MTSTMAYLAKVFIKAIGASRVSCAQLDEDSKHELQEKDDAAQVVLEPAARVEVEELEALLLPGLRYTWHVAFATRA